MNATDRILTEYQVRKSNKEKTQFVEYIKNRLAESGYDKETDIAVEEKGKGIFKSRNIVVGNPETAEVVITAHYDTCAVLPFPNLMAPTNPLIFIGYQILLIIMIVVLAAIPTFILGLLFDNALITVWGFELFLILLLIQVMFGIRNKHTANDNTSGVITITRFLEALPKEQRSKVCVVYFDNEEKGLFGSSFFYEKHKKEMKQKMLINLDCVGDGKEIVTMAKQAAREDEKYSLLVESFNSCVSAFDGEYLCKKMMPMMFPSDQIHFSKGIGVCAVRKSPMGRYVARIHTLLDNRCREANVEYLVRVMVRVVEKI